MRTAVRSQLLHPCAHRRLVRHRAWLTRHLPGTAATRCCVDAACTLLPYGSLVTGLALADADADYALVFHAPRNKVVTDSDTLTCCGSEQAMLVPTRSEQLAVLQCADRHMLHACVNDARAYSGYKSQCILHARTPFVQCEVQSDDHEDDTATLHFDISASPYGVLNSHLLAAYMQRSARLRVGALLLKLWGRSEGLVDSRHGWLSSYAFTIMFIYFMQHTRRMRLAVDEQQVMQCLLGQLQRSDANCLPHDAADAPFMPLLSDDEVAAVWKESVDDVRGFFAFYGDDAAFDLDEYVVDIRRHSPLVTCDEWRQSTLSTMSDAERFALLGHAVLLVRDPYEAHNLARGVDFFRAEATRDALRRAAKKSAAHCFTFS